MSRPLKILIVHNRYQHAGGEDSVFANEAALLRSAGHQVTEHVTTNEHINSAIDKAMASLSYIWNANSYSYFKELLDDLNPDIVHVHNLFPHPSASIFWACADMRIPSIWTLHNYRITCANGLLYRDAQPCTDCVGRWPAAGVRHGCYRGSRTGTAAVAASIVAHRVLGTWERKVTRFIALTDFAKDQFVVAGLPADRITVKPNFVHAPATPQRPRDGALYVGRLSAEKGVETLVKAWTAMDGEKLSIVGDGPLREKLESIAGANVHFLGQMNPKAVNIEMASAKLMIVPSEWYENFPMTIVEAMAAGTPILASRIGALTSILETGVTGLHFTARDEVSLTVEAKNALADPQGLRDIAYRAKKHYDQYLSPSANLVQMERIYHAAIRDYA